MNELQHYEAELLMDNMIYSNKDEWERTRMLMYASLSPYLKRKNITPEELYPLATDDNYKEIYKENAPTTDDFIRMRDISNEFARKINSNKYEQQIKMLK